MSPVLAIIGPSAAGKSSLVRELYRRGLVAVHPTWTTRPPRRDEIGKSVEHRFVTDAEFDALVAEGFFAETATMFGLPYRYGLPTFRADAATSPRVTVVMVRACLLDRLRAHVPVWQTYQIEAAPDEICNRLRARGSGEEETAARIADNQHETALGRGVADRMFDNYSSIEHLADRVVTALSEDQRESRVNSGMSNAARGAMTFVGAVLAAMVVIAGLVCLAYPILIAVGMSNHGSNK